MLRSLGLWLLAATAVAQSDQQATHALRHNLAPGTSYGFALTTEAFLEPVGQAAAEASHVKIVLHFAVQIEAGKDGLLDAAHKVVRVEGNAETKLTKANYDSAKSGSDPGAMKPLASLVGKTFVVGLDANGQIGRAHV